MKRQSVESSNLRSVGYDDGSWSERAEYDGSEWWEHKKCPEYPSELLAD